MYVCIMNVCVKVECQSVEEACEAASAGADIVMLDNFKAVRKSRRGLLVYVCMYVCICLQDDIHGAAEQVKLAFPHVLLEASGVTAVYRISSLLCTLYVNMPFPLP